MLTFFRSPMVLVAAAALTVAPAVPAPAPTPYQLGQLTLQQGGDASCPTGSTCQPFTVACPGVSVDARGAMAIGQPTAAGTPNRGTVVLFSGGGGGDWWSHGGPQTEDFLAQLRQDGLHTVEVRWEDQWLYASNGERAGTARLGCRPSTVIAWIHDHLYTPPAVGTAAPGRCGFCITGNSGGASQVSYALAYYGLDSVLDAVVPTSGPPHAAQAEGCLDVPGFEYRTIGNRRHIDSAWGYLHDDGPCVNHGVGFDFTAEWRANSPDTGGTDYFHPRTRVQFIFGGKDQTNSPAHGRTYEQALKDHGSPMVSDVVVPDMGHGIGSPAGLAALRTALEG